MLMRRWVVATIAFVVHTAIMFAVGTTVFYVLWEPIAGWAEAWHALRGFSDLLREPEWWTWIGVPVVLLTITQAMFLIPYFHRRPLTGQRSKSMKLSIAALAIVPTALTIAMICALFGLADLIRDNVHPDGMERWRMLVFLAVLPASWIIWTVLLILFTRRMKTPGVSRRFLGLLFGGTIVEFILILPLDAMVRRETDCYCETRAFVAMCLSIWALLWLTGPGVVLLLTRRYRARLWSKSHCWKCGFAKGPSPGPRCPECGHAWSVEDSVS